jgi:predicted CXXCH cytochrome family protein
MVRSLFSMINLQRTLLPVLRYAIVGIACMGMQWSGVVVQATTQTPGAIQVVTPSRKKAVVHECVCAIAGTITDPSVQSVEMYATTQASHLFDLNTADKRKQFMESLGRYWKPGVVAGTLSMIAPSTRGDSTIESFSWDLFAAPTAQTFWSTPAGKKLLHIINDPTNISVRLALTGWRRSDAVISTVADKHWFSATMYLDPGVNTVSLIARSLAGVTIDIDTVEAYYQIDFVADKPGEGFEKFTFHGTENETQCRTCHPVKPFASKEACTPCHIGYSNQRFTHTPSKRRQCMSCHDSTSTNFKTIKSLGSDADICYTCHTKNKEAWGAEGLHRHAPFEGGACLQCHSPHSTPNVYHTVAPINTLCASCHEKKEEFLHPVSGHPHTGVAEPLRPSRELTCASCHEPHVSPFAKMLRYGSGAQQCFACHPK